MGTIFALAFGYFSIAYYAYKAIKLLKENWGVISAPLSFIFREIFASYNERKRTQMNKDINSWNAGREYNTLTQGYTVHLKGYHTIE